jgi:hypothetical protein
MIALSKSAVVGGRRDERSEERTESAIIARRTAVA